jgi:hypothetical protein
MTPLAVDLEDQGFPGEEIGRTSQSLRTDDLQHLRLLVAFAAGSCCVHDSESPTSG